MNKIFTTLGLLAGIAYSWDHGYGYGASLVYAIIGSALANVLLIVILYFKENAFFSRVDYLLSENKMDLNKVTKEQMSKVEDLKLKSFKSGDVPAMTASKIITMIRGDEQKKLKAKKEEEKEKEKEKEKTKKT